MHETTKEATLDGLWSGGVAPLGTSSKKLGMWLFIVSDTLTFSAVLLAYSYLRLANPDWPRPFALLSGHREVHRHDAGAAVEQPDHGAGRGGGAPQ